MLDVLSKPETKAEQVERELFANPERSNREIGRVVGCDHKTVGAARERLGSALARIVAPPISPENAEFDPFAPGCAELVVESQMAIAIYVNPRNSVVVRQNENDHRCNDACIFIRQEHLPAVIQRLQQLQEALLDAE